MGRVHRRPGSTRGPGVRWVDVTITPAAPATTIDDVLRNGTVRSVFQPIVELDSGRVVAYEALARGP
jgi:sensor c-di-GMP phosphodiesterase-like protein